MTGHDIARHVERLGVPEGINVIATNTYLTLRDDRVDVFIVQAGDHKPHNLSGDPSHPRAMEAAALLMRAYRAAQVEAGER